ncbi:MAG TPA: prepilin-type N-terminal cleavage/methylation domain-containing protein [Candidatus Saccharimonadales bacterium]|nr:prepilin-type N-terminal cleavage/methylation domain-containing protein [Candidatus Saccharimonadales bacterium]
MKTLSLNESGLTLVELLVAIALAGVVAVSLNTVSTTFIHTAQRGRYLNLANSFAESKVEALRNQGYNSLALGQTSLTSQLPDQLPLGRSATMTVSTQSSGIKQVDLSISYPDQGQTLTYGYTTYIGELGVGQ